MSSYFMFFILWKVPFSSNSSNIVFNNFLFRHDKFYGYYSSIGSLFLFTFVVGLPCGLLCPSLAHNKGYNTWHWFACGVLFNILGLISETCLSDRVFRKQLREVSENKSWASKSNWCHDWLWNIQYTFTLCECLKHNYPISR